jgi:hypothetical protein
MPGGLIDLIFVGQQDVYLKFDANITYFKKVYKRHSNFSMEPIRVELNRTDVNIYDKTTFTVKIPRHGDLIAQIYFVVTFPDTISDNLLSFRWVDYLGENLINNYYITIGGNRVDIQTGDYIHCYTQLSQTHDKQNIYNKMIGNTLEMNYPEQYNLQYNSLSRIPIRYRIGDAYPAVVEPFTVPPGITLDNVRPSIPSRTVYIPLQFWFNKDIGNALPLVSLQYSEVQLFIETNPLSTLYKVFYNLNGINDYYAPNLNITAHRLENFVTNARQTFLISNSVLDMKAHIDCNYIFLDRLERNYFAYKPLEYLVEQVTRIEYNHLNTSTTIDFVLQNPVKEIIWYCRRNNLNVYNDWFNFQDLYGLNIMKSAKILFNGIDRFNSKPLEFFNWLQPYQHHTANRIEGLMSFSFAIAPEDYNPSGSVNASRINNIQFHIETKVPVFDSYAFDVVFFAINYNFLTIASGLGGCRFAS